MSDNNTSSIKDRVEIVSSDEGSVVGTDTALLRIKESPYEDVYFRYGKVSLEEQEGTDKIVMNYSYNIVQVPEHLTSEDLESDSDFEMLLGDLLFDIIVDNVEEKENQDIIEYGSHDNNDVNLEEIND